MNITDLTQGLNNISNMNDSLSLLYEIIVDRNKSLYKTLSTILKEPERIFDTKKFASLLVDLRYYDFIPDIIDTIKTTKGNITNWLSDYLYALGEILNELESYCIADHSFVSLLQNWLFKSDGGEISWNSGIILSNLENEQIDRIMITAIEDKKLFFLTRSACLKRIVDTYGNSKMELYKSLLNDDDKEFVDIVKNLIEYLNN